MIKAVQLVLGNILILALVVNQSVIAGEAIALTSTISWEMQPSFSPDGKTIAYTPDAGGGDNIWVMATDGSNARQVTDESLRLLNNPAWSPNDRLYDSKTMGELTSNWQPKPMYWLQ